MSGDLPKAIAEAEARFARLGRPFSARCRQVLEILIASPTPVKAYSLIEALSTASRAAYPATVYRTLASLQQAGLVHRIPSLNAFSPCSAGDHGHAVTFLICERCGSTEEETDSRRHAPEPTRGSGFEVHAAVVELRGVCGRCAGEPGP